MLQFKEAARQVDAEEIADVLEEQAADAEDAAGAEEGLDAEGTAAFKAQAAAERQNLAADAKVKAAPNLVEADPAIAAAQIGGHVTGGLTDSVTSAEGATKDVREPDLDLSHADSAPGMLMCFYIACSALLICQDMPHALGLSTNLYIVTLPKCGTLQMAS